MRSRSQSGELISRIDNLKLHDTGYFGILSALAETSQETVPGNPRCRTFSFAPLDTLLGTVARSLE